MIQEFALDPNCLDNWKDFRYFYEKFGISEGRLISRFPKGWKKMVYQACSNCSDLDKKRIEERLKDINIKLIKRECNYDKNEDWLTNAENEHLIKPFRAIISRANPRNNCNVIISDDLNDNDPRWMVSRVIKVPRRSDNLSSILIPLFACSTQIIFVDPNFGPEKRRYRNTLKSYLEIAYKYCKNIIRLEFHLKKQSEYEFFLSECNSKIQKIVPQGMKLRFVRWEQKEGGEHLHARYILTEVGGMLFESGLDEGRDGETTDVSLLDKDHHRQCWYQYQIKENNEENSFNFTDEVYIIGKRTMRLNYLIQRQKCMN